LRPPLRLLVLSVLLPAVVASSQVADSFCQSIFRWSTPRPLALLLARLQLGRRGHGLHPGSTEPATGVGLLTELRPAAFPAAAALQAQHRAATELEASADVASAANFGQAGPTPPLPPQNLMAHQGRIAPFAHWTYATRKHLHRPAWCPLLGAPS